MSDTRTRDPEVIEWKLSNGDTVVWLVRETPDGKVYLSGQSRPGYLNSRFGSPASQAAFQLFTQSGFSFWTQAENDLWAKEQKQQWSFALKGGLLDLGLAADPADLPARLETYAAIARLRRCSCRSNRSIAGTDWRRASGRIGQNACEVALWHSRHSGRP